MSQLKILIEATDAFTTDRRGIGVQMRSWLESAPFNEFPDCHFVICHQELEVIEHLHLKTHANVNVQSLSGTPTHVDNLYDLRPDVILFPTIEKNNFRNTATKVIAVDYGMEDFYARKYIPQHTVDEHINQHEFALSHFDGIVTVSKTSKRDLAWFFPEYKNKLAVVYPGIATAKAASSATLPTVLRDERYFLVVGYEHKKNILRITSAFDQFKRSTHSTTRLAIIGKKGFGAAEIDNHILQLSSANEILCLGYMPEHEKQLLLSGCHALVALPIYEGFGLSALEGLRANKIVLVSNNGSLKEIVGNAGFSADPFSISSIARQLAAVDTLESNPRQKYTAARIAAFDQTVQARKLLKYLVKVARQNDQHATK